MPAEERSRAGIPLGKPSVPGCSMDPHNRAQPLFSHREALSHRDSGRSHREARVMPFSALAPLSALLGWRPPAPKPGKLVATGVPGSRPSGAASMRRVDGSREGSRDAHRAKCPGGQGQATCSSGASAAPLHSTGICALQATPEDTASILKQFSGCETCGDKFLTFCLQGR